MKSSAKTAPQGIMTVEAGAITGDVEIATEDSSDGVTVTVAYAGAKDVYTVEGSPAKAGTDHEELVSKLLADTGEATRLG